MTEAAVSFAGNLTEDPEVRSTEDGIARAMAVIAASPRPLPVRPAVANTWPYSPGLVRTSQVRVSPEAWPTCAVSTRKAILHWTL